MWITSYFDKSGRSEQTKTAAPKDRRVIVFHGFTGGSSGGTRSKGTKGAGGSANNAHKKTISCESN